MRSRSRGQFISDRPFLKWWFLTKRKLTDEWARFGLCPLCFPSLFIKTSKENGCGLSLDVFHVLLVVGKAIFKEMKDDWWMNKIWALLLSFLKYISLKNAKRNRPWLINCLRENILKCEDAECVGGDGDDALGALLGGEAGRLLQALVGEWCQVEPVLVVQ